MKRTKTLLALLAALTFTAKVYGQSPYDFSATAPSGQTLYYKISDSAQVSVVNPRTNNSDSNYVAGDLVIPETVSYCGTTYTVTGLSTHNFMMGTFYNCKTLTSVYVPNSVKTMGDYVFGYCPLLVSVHLPDSITSIPNMAFEGCTSLPSITIGRCVRNIFSDAFLHCYAISELHLLASVAPTVGYRALWNIPDTARVYIPCGSTSSYAAVPEWNNHFSAFIEVPTYVLEVSADDETHGSVEIVSEPTCDNPQAELLATANEGYHFDHWSNGSTDNPLTFTLTRDTAIVAYFENNAPDTIWRTVTVTTNAADVAEPYGSGYYPDSSIVEIGYMITDTATQGGHWQFLCWSDGGTDNPRDIVVTSDTAIVALFEWVADSTEGISGVDMLNAKVYSSQGQIVVDGAEGETVRIFDITGRSVRNEALPTGVYIVKVGGRPARKVVVMN